MKKTASLKITFSILVLAAAGCQNPGAQPPQASGYLHAASIDLAGSSKSITTKYGSYSTGAAVILEGSTRKALLQDLWAQNLTRKADINEIPEFIMTFLAGFSGNGKFDIANPGEKWQEDWGRAGQVLPAHQLVYFGEGESIALFSFYTAGPKKSQQALIIKFENNRVLDFWLESVPATLTSRDGIINYLQTGSTGNC